MNNVILMLKISTVALAVLVVILVVLTVLWIRAELRAKRAEASLKIYRGKLDRVIERISLFDPAIKQCEREEKAFDAISEVDILNEEDKVGGR